MKKEFYTKKDLENWKLDEKIKKFKEELLNTVIFIGVLMWFFIILILLGV